MLASALVLALVAAGALGCLSSADGSDDGQDRGPDLGVPSAYFILTGTDLRAEDWPAGFAHYDVFVCTPELTASSLSQARTDRPDALFLAYTSAYVLQLRLFSGPYWSQLEAVFDTTLCVRDIDGDRLLRVFESDQFPDGLPCYVMQQESAEVLVGFHRDVTLPAGFDGLYVDTCWSEFPAYHLDRMFDKASRLDVNGDGLPDSREDISLLYATWRPYFTERLRVELGDQVVLVANSGGRLDDPRLNGITLEGVGDRFNVASAREYFDNQRLVAHLPFVGVAWATTVRSEGPSRDLVPEMDGLHYGFVSTR